MRLGEVADLPSTLDADAVADLLGVSVKVVYRAVRNGELPPDLMPIKVGRRLVWPAARVLREMGLVDDAAEVAASGGGLAEAAKALVTAPASDTESKGEAGR